MHRRAFMRLGGAAASAILLVRSRAASAQSVTPAAHSPVAAPGGQPAVVTPNGSTLPLRVIDGVKVGHLIAEPVHNVFTPGLEAECWGYNGSTPGPTIEAIEGD